MSISPNNDIKFSYSAELKLSISNLKDIDLDTLLEHLESGELILSFNKKAIIDREGYVIAKIRNFNSLNTYISDCSRYI